MDRWHIMYLTGSWLVFFGRSPRSASRKVWCASKLEAQQFVEAQV